MNDFLPILAVELARRKIISRSGDHVAVRTTLKALAAAMADQLERGEQVRFPGVGTIIPYDTKEAFRTNPKTGQRFLAPSRRRLKWRTNPALAVKIRDRNRRAK